MSSVGVLRATAVIAATALVTLVLRWYQRQTRRMVEPRPPRDKCLFCLIGDGKFGGPLLYSDDRCAVFRDIAPAGDVHLLVVPRQHFDNILQLDASHVPLVQHMREKVTEVALAQGGVVKSAAELQIGFTRPPWNTVLHVHMHCISRPFKKETSPIRAAFMVYPSLFATVDVFLGELRQRVV